MVKKDNKKAQERDEKGRFVKGKYKGGPGRKGKSNLDLKGLSWWEQAERVISQYMTAKDGRVSLKATDLLMKLQSIKKPEGAPVIGPVTVDLLRIIKTLGGIDGLKKMMDHCPGCSWFKSEVFSSSDLNAELGQNDKKPTG